jgi:antirestriction protein ArdC
MKINDVYEKVTQSIIDQLENGLIPWRAEWFRGEAPVNFFTEKHYGGYNSFSLRFDMMLRGWSDHRFAGFKQIKENGGKLIKGSKGVKVMWIFEKREEPDEEGNQGKLLYIKAGTATVFNIAAQTTGIELPPLSERVTEFTPIEAAEKIVDGYKDCPVIERKGLSAFYVPKQDKIGMPEHFEKMEAYYGTLFHELGHSTGHQSRLAREGVVGKNTFFSKSYGKEELIAELCAVMLAGECGLDVDIKNHAAYVAGWLTKIKEDRSILIKAASQATKAVEYILGKAISFENIPPGNFAGRVNLRRQNDNN